MRRQSAFSLQFGNKPIAQRKIQIPAHATKDHLSFIMSPVEWNLGGNRHGLLFYPTAGELEFRNGTVRYQLSEDFRCMERMFVRLGSTNGRHPRRFHLNS